MSLCFPGTSRAPHGLLSVSAKPDLSRQLGGMLCAGEEGLGLGGHGELPVAAAGAGLDFPG